MTSGPDGSSRETHPGDVPDGVDVRGVLPARGGRNVFIIASALTVALLALTFTLGWIVYHRLVSG